MIGFTETGYTVVTVWRNSKYPPRYYALLPNGIQSQWSYSYEQAKQMGRQLVIEQHQLEDDDVRSLED